MDYTGRLNLSTAAHDGVVVSLTFDCQNPFCRKLVTFDSSRRKTDPSVFAVRKQGKSPWENNILACVAERTSGVGARMCSRVFAMLGAWYYPSARADGGNNRARAKIHASVTEAAEVVCKKSVDTATLEELELQAQLTSDTLMVEEVQKRRADSGNATLRGIDVSGDANWNTRGSGRAFASIVGAYTWIGALTRKVVYMAVFIQMCAVCEGASLKNTAPP